MTLIAPGVVNGSLALWARDNATGALYSGASPLSSTPIFDGVLDQPVSQLS
ncbi:MAG TPA: hypothetical protein VHY58_06475 [Streptosporangiaceae bacterium]|jgi:hypothetical protein|nr:hypothetical protein [Streptosporangiaceae bacterium]